MPSTSYAPIFAWRIVRVVRFFGGWDQLAIFMIPCIASFGVMSSSSTSIAVAGYVCQPLVNISKRNIIKNNFTVTCPPDVVNAVTPHHFDRFCILVNECCRFIGKCMQFRHCSKLEFGRPSRTTAGAVLNFTLGHVGSASDIPMVTT